MTLLDRYLDSYRSVKYPVSNLPPSLRPFGKIIIAPKSLLDLFAVILILVAVVGIAL